MTEIAVFYMGNAGSSTVIQAAKALGMHASRAFDHLEPAQEAYPYILTLAREPVAKNIDAFFNENAHIMAQTGEQFSELMVDEFLHAWKSHDQPADWFKRTLLTETGLDVYEQKFDRRRGWSVYQREGRSILIIRTDKLTAQLIPALEALTGLELPDVTVEHRGKGTEKYGHGVSDVYGAFVQNVELPEDYLDRMYGTEYAKQFFYAKELAELKSRWLGVAKE